LAGRLPDPKLHPNLYFWASMTDKFSDAVRAKWGPGELQLPAGGVEMPKKAAVAAAPGAPRQ
jgi:hypothetical protein